MLKKTLTLAVALLFLITSFAQKRDSTLVNSILKKIDSAQIQQKSGFYKGNFLSIREAGGFPHNAQADNNMFFTALVAFTLKNQLPNFNPTNSKIASDIVLKSNSVFRFYQHKSGLPFYSFWPTDAEAFPHSFFVRFFKKSNPGQDADCAVMSLMAMQANDSTCRTLAARMREVANLSRKKTESTLTKYRSFAAYGTWLGYGMNPDFDFCVQCNILYFMFENNLPLRKQDSATIHLLCENIKNRDVQKMPAFISPSYIRTPVLLYHISRLMARFKIDELENYRVQITEDLKYELKHSNMIMDKVIISTSLLRLGEKVEPLNFNSIADVENASNCKFSFFDAKFAFSYRSWLKSLFINSKYLTYHFYCPPYNLALIMEYLMESEKSVKN